MRNAIKFIPNFITLCNIMCGVLGIYCAMTAQLSTAFWLMILAAVFDFCDGLAARVLNARSEIGLQLDSLCDVVSFGVLPSFMLFAWFSSVFATLCCPVLCFGAFLLAPFAALRLAVFNVDTEQSSEFRGLPTPAMALFVGSLVLSFGGQPICPLLGMSIVVALCVLMVCRLPMLSFKFKGLGLSATNIARYSLVLATILCIIFFGVYPTPAIIIGLYVFISLLLGCRAK